MASLISKASLLMVPSVYEDGTLYNVLPSGNKAPDETGNHNGYDQTRADFTFSRGSNLAATRIGPNGLIEKGRENLLTYSNTFSDSAWSKSNSSVTSGQVDKDGGSTAWKFNETATTGEHQLKQNYSDSGVNCLSIYAKAGERDVLIFRMNLGGWTNVVFNLTSGSVVSTGTFVDATITNVGGGWYRCEATFSGLSGSTIQYQIGLNDTTYNYTGEAGKGIYIQNAQLEYGLAASSYLDSGATTATAGVLENTPRIDYSSGAGALLLEPQRTNLIPQSEYFGAWTLNGGGTGSNPVLDFGYTSPEGVDNAYKVTFDTGAGTTTSDESIMYISKSGLTAGNDYTASVYLKGAVGGEEVIVRDTEGSYTKWTLTTEWKRYEMTQTAAGSSYATSFGVRQGLGGIGTINSNAVVYMYAFQSEAGSHVSSYVPTYGSAATRGADSITSGTITAPLSGGYTAFIEAETLSTSDYNQIQFRETAANYVLRIGNQVNVGSGALIQANTTGMNKFALQVSSGGAFELFKNGSSVGTGTGITHDIELIKTDLAGQNVKKIIIFNEALTDAECQTLTA